MVSMAFFDQNSIPPEYEERFETIPEDKQEEAIQFISNKLLTDIADAAKESKDVSDTQMQKIIIDAVEAGLAKFAPKPNRGLYLL
jgi:hypothetical protein